MGRSSKKKRDLTLTIVEKLCDLAGLRHAHHNTRCFILIVIFAFALLVVQHKHEYQPIIDNSIIIEAERPHSHNYHQLSHDLSSIPIDNVDSRGVSRYSYDGMADGSETVIEEYPNILKATPYNLTHPRPTSIDTGCWIHHYNTPIPNVQLDMLWVRDSWLWPDFSHLTILHEQVSLCHPQHNVSDYGDIFNKRYQCKFYFNFTDASQTVYVTNVTAPFFKQYARNMPIDCPIPVQIRSLLFHKYYGYEYYPSYIPLNNDKLKLRRRIRRRPVPYIKEEMDSQRGDYINENIYKNNIFFYEHDWPLYYPESRHPLSTNGTPNAWQFKTARFSSQFQAEPQLEGDRADNISDISRLGVGQESSDEDHDISSPIHHDKPDKKASSRQHKKEINKNNSTTKRRLRATQKKHRKRELSSPKEDIMDHSPHLSSKAYGPHAHVRSQHNIDSRVPYNQHLIVDDWENMIGKVEITPLPETIDIHTTVDPQSMTVTVPVCQRPIVDFGVPFQPKRHYLAACTMITGDAYVEIRKGETIPAPTARLVEWIEYHLMIGFEHFYIYDNSKQAYGEVYRTLLDYIQSEMVTYVWWPHPMCSDVENLFDKRWYKLGSQMSGHSSCFGHFGFYNQWMANMDVDEFFIPGSNFVDVTGNNLQLSTDEEWRQVMPRMIQSFEQRLKGLNFFQFPSRLALPCDKIGMEAYDNRDDKISVMSHFQCFRAKVERRNKKNIVRTSQGRTLQIHFPVYSYPKMKTVEYNISDKAIHTDGYLLHSRMAKDYSRWHDYVKSGKTDEVSPPDPHTMAIMRRLHQRLSIRFLKRKWDALPTDTTQTDVEFDTSLIDWWQYVRR